MAKGIFTLNLAHNHLPSYFDPISVVFKLAILNWKSVIFRNYSGKG